MNKIQAIIIEDELPAARFLHKMIQEIRPEWEVTVLPGTIEDSVKWFAENPHPDVLFLDIQLNDGNSFLFIEQANPQSMIVFTTAYDENYGWTNRIYSPFKTNARFIQNERTFCIKRTHERCKTSVRFQNQEC